MADVPIAFSSTISSISGDVLTLGSTPPTLPTFGWRFIWFVDGAGAEEVRKIIARTSTTITVDDLPAGVLATDTIRISTTLEELEAAATGTTTFAEDGTLILAEDMLMRNGSYVALFDQTLAFTGSKLFRPSGTDGIFQMGYKRPDGVIEGASRYNICNGQDDTGASNPLTNSGGLSSGFRVRWYGSQLSIGGNVFHYFLDGANVNATSIIDGNTFNINGGFRIGGSGSILKDNFFTVHNENIDSNIYPFTTRGVLSEVSNNTVYRGRQAFYWAQNVGFGGSTTVRGQGGTDVTYDIRIASGSTGQTLTLIDDTLTDVLVTDGSSSSSCSIDRYVGLRPTLLNLDGTALEGVFIRNENTDEGQVLTGESNADGSFTEQLVWRQTDPISSSGINYYNNTIRMAKYGKVTTEKTWDSREPFTTIEFFADDESISATESAAQTLAGTMTVTTGTKTIAIGDMSAQDAYDALMYWWINTNQLAIAKFFSLSSGILDLTDWNIDVDATDFTGGVKTTGTIAVSNGGTLADGTYTAPITIAGASSGASDIILSASTLSVPDIDQLTGTLALNGASTVTINASGGGTFPSGTASATAKFVISSSVADDDFDGTAFVFDASTVIENTSGNNINLALEVGQQAPTKLETSGTITFVTPTVTIDVTAPNLLDNSRVRLYNVTQTAEIDNSIVSGGSGYTITITEGTEYDSGDSLVLLATYQEGGTAKNIFRGSATATTTDIAFSDSQTNWVNHNTAGVDGSTVSECSTDYVGIEVEVNDGDNSTTKSRIAAFIVDALTAADGIRNWVTIAGNPVITYNNAGSATIDKGVVNLEINNVKAAPLDIVDAFKLRASDGSSLVDNSDNTINFDNTAEAVVVETGVSGLTAAESEDLAEIGAVKVKTDSLTFTVAGQVDANIQYVNDVQVSGTGAEGDEWGP